MKGKAGGGGAAHHEPHTAEQRARSKWSSRREKTDRRMSSFSDCAVYPEPVAAGRRLDLTAAAAPPVSSIPLLRPSPPLWPGFRTGQVTTLPTVRLSPRPRDPRVTEQTAPRLSGLYSTESTLVHSSRPNRVTAPAIDGPHELLWTDRRKPSGRW